MKKYSVLFVFFAFIHSGCMSSNTSYTRPAKGRQIVTVVKKAPGKSHRKNKKVIVKKVVIGSRIKTLPSRHVVIYFNKLPFIYSEGIFYKKLANSEYEIIKPEIGMLVPELPDYNVTEVKVNGKTLLLFDGTLFKQIPTTNGLQYEVVGFIDK